MEFFYFASTQPIMSKQRSGILRREMFKLIAELFKAMFTENAELSDEKINELVDAFMNALPVILKKTATGFAKLYHDN